MSIQNILIASSLPRLCVYIANFTVDANLKKRYNKEVEN